MSSEDEEDETAETESAEAEVVAPVVREEPAEVRTSEARRKLRDQMQAEIDAFLRAGGRIEQVAPSAGAEGTPLTATAGNEVG